MSNNDFKCYEIACKWLFSECVRKGWSKDELEGKLLPCIKDQTQKDSAAMQSLFYKIRYERS